MLEYRIRFTTARYLLLIPAFVFTSSYQKRATELHVPDYEADMKRLRMWAAVGMVVILILRVALAV